MAFFFFDAFGRMCVTVPVMETVNRDHEVFLKLFGRKSNLSAIFIVSPSKRNHYAYEHPRFLHDGYGPSPSLKATLPGGSLPFFIFFSIF
jgi:hypothetical protein